MKNKYVLVFIFLSLRINVIAQEIDNTTSYKNINEDTYLRLSVDNDFFTGRDEQYTEGLNIEFCSPHLKKNPLTWLLINPHFSHTKYGIGLEQAGYTPYDLTNPKLQVSDRPYAATLFLKTFLIATDTENKQRFATTLSTGVIGQAALGEEIQDGVHKILGDVVPPGWQYQIRNDAILNYQVNYEKQFLAYRNMLSFDGDISARAGTLNDKASLGVTLITGYFESPFAGQNIPSDKFHVYLYDRPEVDFIGYDATLEGGLFDHTSPYTIPAADINRAILADRAGCVISYKMITYEFFEFYSSRDFSTGPRNKWGGMELAIAFK